MQVVLSRPYQIWANDSDLHISWSKVAVGLIIHKIESIVIWRLLYEHFHGINPKNIKMQGLNNRKSLNKKFF